MTKKITGVLVVLVFMWAGSANAAIVDLGNITRDTSTGLDWLDVTKTRGLSYNQVLAEMAAGGTYEGYRYAITAELDQLITNFGYVPVQTDCNYDLSNCDVLIPAVLSEQTEQEVTEYMIRTLGDTVDAHWDEIEHVLDVAPSGAGGTTGFLGDTPYDRRGYGLGEIYDVEAVFRVDGTPFDEQGDRVHTGLGGGYLTDYDLIDIRNGSFLVSEVPLPTAAWLFGSALLGLGALKRKKA